MAFTSRNDDDVMSEMNITPLVDVMLVLLVVFIVTAPMLTNAIPIQLPKTAAVAPADRADPIVISIDAEQRVFINKENLAREQLVPRLQQAKASNTDLVVQVQADKEANYGAVAALLADVEQAGITRLSLLTQK
ncbi:biopolymer transporter ExbD [Pectobacterium parmentieri]|uniref:Biopolymer transporter ExbD n=1 Tax=Pectobacterium parmentieri TaxID=1905730 RepID=A0A8B3FJJ1_PECPM|nr:biopolymer transporter ExbD [Pectobacterium parmentieri]AOR61114.1 biopolymer transporter ExbD [Pectobacterium parmentieri]AYH03407.1 biopolymer transporter ExbD [Pectobacterium parmentieri]AYH07740.1 biopolymer transporter ExbD [Pectobacterium parmentieri]AYH12218.1 biopolymer transporter ExbD [Pectobacterium parmentieri]AYH16494.1 biopolymer transporter ExbD [Pectobacterium parmentieri]